MKAQSAAVTLLLLASACGGFGSAPRITPNGTGLHAVWGANPSNLYAVGEYGTIVHSIGDDRWSVEATGTTEPLFGVWGANEVDVYAVGGTTGAIILRSTGGGKWSALQGLNGLPALVAIWGSGPDDIYAVGKSGAILHSSDGVTFHLEESGLAVGAGLTGVWGSSASDIYAVSDTGVILRSAGQGAWALVSHGNCSLTGVFGTSAHDVYAIGCPNGTDSSAGTVLHSTGDGTFAPMSSGTLSPSLFGIASDGLGHVVAVGSRWAVPVTQPSSAVLTLAGGTWNAADPSGTSRLLGAWGGEGELYVVGQDPGIIIHYVQAP